MKAQYCWAHLIREMRFLQKTSRQENESVGRATVVRHVAGLFSVSVRVWRRADVDCHRYLWQAGPQLLPLLTRID